MYILIIWSQTRIITGTHIWNIKNNCMLWFKESLFLGQQKIKFPRHPNKMFLIDQNTNFSI